MHAFAPGGPCTLCVGSRCIQPEPVLPPPAKKYVLPLIITFSVLCVVAVVSLLVVLRYRWKRKKRKRLPEGEHLIQSIGGSEQRCVCVPGVVVRLTFLMSSYTPVATRRVSETPPAPLRENFEAQFFVPFEEIEFLDDVRGNGTR